MKRTRIKPISDKRRLERKEYLKRRERFLSEHSLCEAKIKHLSTKRSTQIHHKAGCFHGRLNNEKYWLATCYDCHVWITEHKEDAKRLGFTLEGEYEADQP